MSSQGLSFLLCDPCPPREGNCPHFKAQRSCDWKVQAAHSSVCPSFSLKVGGGQKSARIDRWPQRCLSITVTPRTGLVGHCLHHSQLERSSSTHLQEPVPGKIQSWPQGLWRRVGEVGGSASQASQTQIPATDCHCIRSLARPVTGSEAPGYAPCSFKCPQSYTAKSISIMPGSRQCLIYQGFIHWGPNSA